MGLLLPRKKKRRNKPKALNDQDRATQGGPPHHPRHWKKPHHVAVLDQRAERLGIAYFYIHALGCPPPSEWGGKSGTIATIRDTFDIPKGSRDSIRKVLGQVQLCAHSRKQYRGSPLAPPKPRERVIKLGSVEAQIVADSMEQRTIILLQNNTYWHIVTLLYTSTNVVHL
jgi:hypothetical protein